MPRLNTPVRRAALVMPRWRQEDLAWSGLSTAPLPIELACCAARLAALGVEVLFMDGNLQAQTNGELATAVADFAPDLTVVAVAPQRRGTGARPIGSDAPRALADALGDRGGTTVAVGAGSTQDPASVLTGLGVDMVVLGEPEEVVAALARTRRHEQVRGLAWLNGDSVTITGPAAMADLARTPALAWPEAWLLYRDRRRQRSDGALTAPAAQVEASREGPRSEPRLRSLKALLLEIDGLTALGVKELEFVDEALPPWPALLQALRRRDVRFTARVRASAWPSDLLDLLHEAGWRAYAEEPDVRAGLPGDRSNRRPSERPSLNG